MYNYIIRRLFFGLITLVLITFSVYGLIRHMPGTPLTMDLAEGDPSKKISDEDLKRLNRIYGLDKPWHVAYFQWLGNAVRGEFGRSFRRKEPVAQIVWRALGPTLLLTVTSLVLAYAISVPMGLFATVRSGKPDERFLSTVLYMLYSVPSYVAGLLMLLFFYVQLEGTPFQLEPGMTSPDYEELSFLGKVGDILKHMIMPVICFTYASLAYFTRFVKSNMQEVIRQDYIRTARAKGVPRFRVITHHAFRNTLIPFVTLVGLTLPTLVSGAVILEMIFNWPGMGSLFIDALTNRDYPIIMALALIFAVMTLLGQLLADLLYAVVDPRITYS